MTRTSLLIASIALLHVCCAGTTLPPRLSPQDPANPAADEPAPERDRLLLTPSRPSASPSPEPGQAGAGRGSDLE